MTGDLWRYRPIVEFVRDDGTRYVPREEFDALARELARREAELGPLRGLAVLAAELAKAWDDWDGNPDNLRPLVQLGEAHRALSGHLDSIGKPDTDAAATHPHDRMAARLHQRTATELAELLRLVEAWASTPAGSVEEDDAAGALLDYADRLRRSMTPPAERDLIADAGEPCPDCGGDPAVDDQRDDDLHTDHCPRLGTTGQFGPPWQPKPWGSLPAAGQRCGQPNPRQRAQRCELADDHAGLHDDLRGNHWPDPLPIVEDRITPPHDVTWRADSLVYVCGNCKGAWSNVASIPASCPPARERGEA